MTRGLVLLLLLLLVVRVLWDVPMRLLCVFWSTRNSAHGSFTRGVGYGDLVSDGAWTTARRRVSAHRRAASPSLISVWGVGESRCVVLCCIVLLITRRRMWELVVTPCVTLGVSPTSDVVEYA